MESKTYRQQSANPYRAPTKVVESPDIPRWSYTRYALVGALIAASLPVGFIGSLMLLEVMSGATYQGQLYHEDGPEVFFIIFGSLMCISGLVFAFVGAIIGLLARKLV